MEIKNEFCAQFSSSSRVKGFWSNPIPTKRQIRACNLWPGQIELSHCSRCRSVASGLKKKFGWTTWELQCHQLKQKIVYLSRTKMCASFGPGATDLQLEIHCSWHNQNTKINASLVSGQVRETQWNRSLHFKTYPLFLSHSPKKEGCVMSMVSFLDYKFFIFNTFYMTLSVSILVWCLRKGNHCAYGIYNAKSTQRCYYMHL